jgi:macrolide transport system ATP-binding/permease protein
MVTHEPNLAQAATRTIRLQDGLVIADETRQAPSVSAQSRQISIAGHAAFNMKRTGSYFVQAIRSLFSNKTRSALSILGVLIGVTSVIAMLALGTGAQEDVKKRISSLGSNLLTVRAASGRMGGISLEGGSQIRLTLEDLAAIREKITGLDMVSGRVSGRGQVVYGGKNWNTSGDGVSPDYAAIHNSVPEYGRFFNDNENVTRAKVAVVGQTIVREVFGGKNPIGEFMKIRSIDFQVIGVLPAKGATGWRDEDDVVLIPLNTAMYRFLGREFVDNIEVQAKEQGEMDRISDDIKKLLLSLHRKPVSKTELIDIRNMADIQETITATTKTFTFLLGSIAFISLLVGGIGIMNIMLVSVTERTREIGLRKSIGADNRDILFQFIIESIVICLLGGILGILLGSVISLSLAKFAGWSTKISLSSVMLSFTFSALIGLVFGIWPAKKAAALNPIDALRYE